MINSVIGDQLNGVRTLKEWKNLELTPSMKEGTGADTGGVNKLPHGKMIWSPGDPTAFSFTGAIRKAGQVWDNAYAYNQLTLNPLRAIYFGFQVEVAFPAATLNNPRPFEIELDYCDNGLVCNMAWQLKLNTDDGGPGFRMFNMRTGSWEFHVGLPPLRPQIGKFMKLWAHFVIDREAQTCIHDSLVVDDTFYPVGITHVAVPKWGVGTNHFNNAVQWDSDGRGTPLVALLRNYHVRCL